MVELNHLKNALSRIISTNDQGIAYLRSKRENIECLKNNTKDPLVKYITTIMLTSFIIEDISLKIMSLKNNAK